jgi:large subunit ribosomal protein L21
VNRQPETGGARLVVCGLWSVVCGLSEKQQNIGRRHAFSPNHRPHTTNRAFEPTRNNTRSRLLLILITSCPQGKVSGKFDIDKMVEKFNIQRFEEIGPKPDRKGGFSMYAVVSTGGKQYRVAEGDLLRVEKIDGDVGDSVSFDRVLLVSDGEKVTVGQPVVENAAVKGRIVEQGKAKKILVFKYKRRKRYRRKQGHRQQYTAVKIDSIEG